MVKTEEFVDVIRKVSEFGYAKGVSIVDQIIDKGWSTESDLAFAYNDLQESEGERVTAFLQLPFSIKLPEKTWIKIHSEYGQPYIAFSSKNFASNNNFENFELNHSQVFISYQLWERRRKFYPEYLEGLESGLKSVKTTLRSKGIWYLEEYEFDVAKRLWLQTREVLKGFLQTYRIVSRDYVADTPKSLNRYFIMVKNGRIICRDMTEAAYSKRVNPSNLNSNSENNLTTLRKRLKKNAPPSIYEIYFLEVARLIGIGSYDLAVVQTVIILDWFANEIIESHVISELRKSLSDKQSIFELAYERIWENKEDQRIKVGIRDKFNKYFPVVGLQLPTYLSDSLKRIINQRNKIVHRYQLNLVDESVAKEALETGMAIVQFCMDNLTSKNAPKIKS